MTIDPTTLYPERSPGVKCGQSVWQGSVATPCTLPQGHQQEADPPPCYAMESPVSVRSWQRWALRQLQDVENGKVAPVHKHTWSKLSEDRTEVKCAHCSETRQVEEVFEDQPLTPATDTAAAFSSSMGSQAASREAARPPVEEKQETLREVLEDWNQETPVTPEIRDRAAEELDRVGMTDRAATMRKLFGDPLPNASARASQEIQRSHDETLVNAALGTLVEIRSWMDVARSVHHTVGDRVSGMDHVVQEFQRLDDLLTAHPEANPWETSRAQDDEEDIGFEAAMRNRDRDRDHEDDGNDRAEQDDGE